MTTNVEITEPYERLNHFNLLKVSFDLFRHWYNGSVNIYKKHFVWKYLVSAIHSGCHNITLFERKGKSNTKIVYYQDTIYIIIHYTQAKN